MVLDQLASQGVHPASLEAGDLERLPSLGRPEYGGENELEFWLLSESIGNVLRLTVFLNEKEFQEVRGRQMPL